MIKQKTFKVKNNYNDTLCEIDKFLVDNFFEVISDKDTYGFINRTADIYIKNTGEKLYRIGLKNVSEVLPITTKGKYKLVFNYFTNPFFNKPQLDYIGVEVIK